MCSCCIPAEADGPHGAAGFNRRQFLRRVAVATAAIGGGATVAMARSASALPVLETVSGSAPTIITRAQWGADESIRAKGRIYAPLSKLVVHHTASPNRPADPASVVRSMYVAQVRRGYDDIGYNFLIDHRGRVYEGRAARSYGTALHDSEDGQGRGVMGAHAMFTNAGTVGVAMIGTFSSMLPTDDALNSLVRLLAWKVAAHRINPTGSDRFRAPYQRWKTFPNIAGHREVDATACPGRALARYIPTIRQQVKNRTGSFPDRSVDVLPTLRFVDGAVYPPALA